MIAIAARTSSNIYVLSEIGNEKCFLGKEDESWLWHRRMCHIHFYKLVKVNKREEVREMAQITKPTVGLEIKLKAQRIMSGTRKFV